MEGFAKKEELTQFKLYKENSTNLDKSTGELISIKQVTAEIEQEPLYQLWHTCYSLKDKEERKDALLKRFNLPETYADTLANIDFKMGNFSNKSSKALRKILPALVEGKVYSDAMALVGYNHSFSETRQDKVNRKLLNAVPLLQKNALRQPIVEKILNQMINVVNALINTYGQPDEIRVELARELKQSKEERNNFFNSINQYFVLVF